ncbi:MAG: alpha/beta hydrolase [Dehalococcoidales bacterium]|nr:MAG: alpha/beta hydrolase [Dehalococcoidales bacterium]
MKWWWKAVLTLVLVIVVATLGISGYLGYSMTRVERLAVEQDPALVGLDYEDVSFPSMEDELILHGWFLPVADSQGVIIMVHGADQHRADPSIGMLGIASKLVEHGYNVLMFDLRGHGESEGNMMSAGYYEQRDLNGAVEYVKGRGFQRIGVLGFSVGAATAVLATAENSDISALVSDSGFADLKDMMEPEFSKRTKFPKFFLGPLLFLVKIMYGVDFNAVSPVAVVAQIAPRPILFIHGEDDETVPQEHAQRLYQASLNPQNQLWVAPGASHVKAYLTYPEEYINRVTTFFDMTLR